MEEHPHSCKGQEDGIGRWIDDGTGMVAPGPQERHLPGGLLKPARGRGSGHVLGLLH